MRNGELWNTIRNYDLDSFPGEYGFKIRLEKENQWTRHFTEQALIEYKKFMYLAAISETMVSPSEVVDRVWHLHLIFTESYQEFCKVIGKQIQHVPSTHNQNEYSKFSEAKERSKQLYITEFKEQPGVIWEYFDMMDCLHLKKAKLRLKTFLIFAIPLGMLLTIPAYYTLRPALIQIANPYFIPAYLLVALSAFLLLEYYNKKQFRKVIAKFHKDSFIFHLHPCELIYLKTGSLGDVANGLLNEMVEKKILGLTKKKSVALINEASAQSREEKQATAILKQSKATSPFLLLKKLTLKPLFSNIASSMDAFRKYFLHSRFFTRIFYLNFGISCAVLLIGAARFATGLSREKPVLQLAVLMTILTFLIILHLYRLTKLFPSRIIPEHYRKEILTRKEIREEYQWNYFLAGAAALTISFIPVKNGSGSSHDDNSYTSCGSSCGSSGGSCGGCGN